MVTSLENAQQMSSADRPHCCTKNDELLVASVYFGQRMANLAVGVDATRGYVQLSSHSAGRLLILLYFERR